MAAPGAVVGWMTAACVVTGAVLVGLTGWRVADVAAGMGGPLVAAAGTWVMVERGARTNPAGLTSLMMTAFVVKLVLFGVYVVVMMRGIKVTPMPFIASFTAAFVGLYVAEAMLMRRLFTPRESAGS